MWPTFVLPSMYVLCRALPQSLLEVLGRMSPASVCRAVSVPVEMVVPPTDIHFPSEEAIALVGAVPTARLTWAA